MYSLAIPSVEKRNSIPDGQDYLAVQFAITRDGEEAYAGSQGFPLDSSREDIQEELERFVRTFAEDAARSEENAKVEATQQQADEVIASLEGFQTNAD